MIVGLTCRPTADKSISGAALVTTNTIAAVSVSASGSSSGSVGLAVSEEPQRAYEPCGRPAAANPLQQVALPARHQRLRRRRRIIHAAPATCRYGARNSTAPWKIRPIPIVATKKPTIRVAASRPWVPTLRRIGLA